MTADVPGSVSFRCSSVAACLHGPFRSCYRVSRQDRRAHCTHNVYRHRGWRQCHSVRCSATASARPTLQTAFPLLQNPTWQDAGAMFAAIALGAALVKTFDSLSHRDIVDKKLSRKLVHMLAGPGFMLCWPLFSTNPSARFFAAVVPSLNIVRLLLIGFGVVEDDRTVKSVSRSGDKGELLRGPLYYVTVLLIATVAVWRTSIIPAVALAFMCGGDGLADIAGRNLQGPKLPHNPNKTWVGSFAMLAGGSAMALAFIAFFRQLGYIHLTGGAVLRVVLGSAILSTIVESLPVSSVLDDNLTVPVVASGTAVLLSRWSSTVVRLLFTLIVEFVLGLSQPKLLS